MEIERKDYCAESEELIFHRKGEKILLDRRVAHAIAMRKKLKETNCDTYKELIELRRHIKIKKQLNEPVLQEYEKVFKKVKISKEDESEAKKYKDVRDMENNYENNKGRV